MTADADPQAKEPRATPGKRDELVFLPIGGVGEIGMNLALYGYGRRQSRTWIAVDFGVAFAHDDMPGVDLILPDISYLEEERTNLGGIFITHAHEDHFGALIVLWQRLRVPVYATAFTAGLLAAKIAGEPGTEPVPVTVVKTGDRIELGPFEVEYVRVAHSIPEAHALAIRTPLGTVLHTGDWKIDPAPMAGGSTDDARLRAIGEEGVLALVCDSTNAMREGHSPSEAEVAREIEAIVAEASGRVAFTTFASHVDRLRAIALAARAAHRDVVVVGRAMRRVIDVAGELNLLDGLPGFLDEDAYGFLPRDKVVLLLTGSQGEPRAALARVAEDDHRNIALSPGDTVVFSSRTIPGNELAINRIVNALISRGIRVITDRDRLVHVSGHPRRDELKLMYAWVKPKIAVPVHGEPQHLAAHAALARGLGVGSVFVIGDGKMLRLAPSPEVVDEVPLGRVYRDGTIVGDDEAVGLSERRRLSFSGIATIAIVLDRSGDLVADPEVTLFGLPRADRAGRPMTEAVFNAVIGTLDSIPRPRRRDQEVVRDAVYRAVRAAVAEAWGKRPNCAVLISVV